MNRYATLLIVWVLAAPFAGAQFDTMPASTADTPEVTLEALTAADGVRPGETLRAAVRVNVSEGWHVHAHEPLEDYLIATELAVETPEGWAVSSTVYPEPEKLETEFSEQPLAVLGGTFLIGVVIAVPESAAPGDYEPVAKLRYQPCNDTQCMAPATAAAALAVRVAAADVEITPQHEDVFAAMAFEPQGGVQAKTSEPSADAAPSETAAASGDAWKPLAEEFEIVAASTGYQNAERFLQFLEDAKQGVSQPQGFAGMSLAWVLVLITVGGVALNLTPCVLPLIPINLAIIGAGAKAGSRTRGFLLGGVYGLGMAAAYGSLGLLVVLGLAGAFGTLNATVWFNAVIAVLFVVLGLAMFDVIMIDFTRFQGKLGLQKKKKKEGGSFVLAFVMGAVAALLAGACVAPVVLSTVLYAQTQYAEGAAAALLLPFLLGVGMGLPWPFAGAGLSFLPKPGGWMTYVKYVFGVFIFIMAAYYAWIGYGLWRGPGAEDAAAPKSGMWFTSLEAGLDRARHEDKPVLIDFWATWCKNCHAMDDTTFANPEVAAAIEADFVPVKYQAEQPEAEPAASVLEHFGVVGLPTYVVARPKDAP